MAKGFESKQVENQQQDAADQAAAKDKARLGVEDIERQRSIAALKLQQANILNARTSNPHRRAALQAALDHVEQQLTALGFTESASAK